jgi:hypothetical protein
MLTRRALIVGTSFAAARAAPVVPYQTPFKYGKLVLGASSEPDAFDSRSVDCPFVFSHDGLFYMTYLGFDGTGYQTGLASSKDLVAWRKLGCILKRDASSPITRYNIGMNWIVRDSRLRSPGALRKVDGKFLGAFHAYPNAGYESGPSVIGLCRSDDLMHWQIGEIILRPDVGAEWERGGLYKPCLVEDHGTFYLFYNAKNTEKRWREQTGVATSRDLKTWTRYAGNPIIATGGADSWDERFASDPAVFRDGKTWVFFYYSLDAKGKARDLLALGPDAFHPRKVDQILIDVGPPGSVDSVYAHKPSVIAHEGVLYHFYCAVSGRSPNQIRGISVARSRPWS